MRILLFKYLTITLLALPLVVNANPDGSGWKGKYTKEKTIKKAVSYTHLTLPTTSRV